MRVYVDPGHGGSDSGAVGPGGIRESALAMEIAARLAAVLRRAGHEVKLSRLDDKPAKVPVKNELLRRIREANAWPADLYLSVHLNAPGTPAESATARGIETYHGQAVTLAKAIQRYLVVFTGAADRGAKLPWKPMGVIKDTKMPGLLVEVGFVTHPGESALLREPSYQTTIANAITAGIMAHYEMGVK
jgi:N-acetylmuramoyl-L-alanine amidase